VCDLFPEFEEPDKCSAPDHITLNIDNSSCIEDVPAESKNEIINGLPEDSIEQNDIEGGYEEKEEDEDIKENKEKEEKEEKEKNIEVKKNDFVEVQTIKIKRAYKPKKPKN
jgi:hypothetical protein